MKENNANCPCGGLAFKTCCEPFLSGKQTPQTSLELMRSRYVAYVLGNQSYLKQTWILPPNPLRLDSRIKWMGLEIVSHHDLEHEGEVEFIARYKFNGKTKVLHEKSRFFKQNGKWYYQDGQHFD